MEKLNNLCYIEHVEDYSLLDFLWEVMLPLTVVQEKLKTIPDEYMDEVYNYLELLQYKILYKKQHEESVKKFPNRRPDILKQPNFYMSPAFDEPLEDFKVYM